MVFFTFACADFSIRTPSFDIIPSSFYLFKDHQSSTSTNMTTPEPNIVAGLPKDTPEVEYDDQMDLLREAQRLFKELKAKKSSCDYVVFKNVPRDKTSDVFDEDTRAQIGDYDEETKILVLQWNGRAHNIAIDRLVLQLSLKLHSLGLGPETKTSWRAEIRLPTRIKQPWQQYIVSVDHYPPGRSENGQLWSFHAAYASLARSLRRTWNSG